MTKAKKFGTFGGVFTPSILTILGVIMYLRMPMISGEAGLIGTLGIIIVAHIISITTGLSVSSIATDKRVKEGGTYYIISRSLGLPIGGTLGLALFVGLSFCVSLYLIGFSESFLGYFDMPMNINNIRITGSIILLVVTIVTFISTSLAIKTQYLIMLTISLSILSILFGKHDLAPTSPNLFGNGSGIPLVVLFGIFFPAVTGFEAGVSMSGDLKDAKKSIPLGTISAIAIGLTVYIALAFFYFFTVDGNALATDPKILFRIALVPQLVIAGIWGATLSSALGSILAAPRILQSTAMDKITPRLFAHGSGASKEPRNALILTFLIAEAGILIGELDVIARVVSIFFITTYGFLNLSAAFESLTSADFRPTFKTPPLVSIIGFLACFLVMIQLDFLAMMAAILILGLLFLLLKQRELVLETGDTWSSVWATLVRTGLQHLNKSTLHTRNWRPNVILFSGQDNARPHLIDLARSITGRLGMFSAFEMVVSDEERLIRDKRHFAILGKKNEFTIHQHKCRNVYEGMNDISRVFGFAGVEPDTILMGWSRHERNKDKFLKLLRNFEESDYNTILLNYNAVKEFGEKRTIDIWWSGWGSNLTFSIFLLRHLTSSGNWKDAKIRLLIVNNQPERNEIIDKRLRQILLQYRINFEIRIINNNIDNISRDELIGRESSGTDLTFIGIPDKQFNHLDQAYDEVSYLTKHLGTFILVNSSSRFEPFDLQLEGISESSSRISTDGYISLPDLVPSKYNIINDDIVKIDINGQKVLTLFNEKAFAPLLTETEKFAKDLSIAFNSVYSQLGKLIELNDKYRIRKAILKIKNDFYYNVNRSFDDFRDKKLILQKEALENGLQWYADRLEKDLLRFPFKILIHYDREDLKIRRKDPFWLKWFILRKRVIHPFSKKSLPGKIQYHEIASYYLKDNRHYFLSSFLSKLQSELLEHISETRGIISSTDALLEKILDNPADFNKEIREAKEQGENKIKAFSSGISQLKIHLKNRLILEFRKNLQQMTNNLAKPDINFRIRRKRRNNKYYANLILNNLLFPDLWYEATLLHLNKIKIDIVLNSYKSRIKDKINEFNFKIDQQLDNRFRSGLNEILIKLQKYDSEKESILGPNFKIPSLEENITLIKDFNLFGKEIIRIAETLPEKLDIGITALTNPDPGQSEEILSVPLRRLTRFYIESRFIGTTYDQLEQISDSCKNTIFIINDLLSLTRFNLENIPADLPDRKKVNDSIIKDACQHIIKEEDKIDLIRNDINQVIDNSLNEVFDKLSAYKINTTVAEYSWFIREHQSKKVKKTIRAYFYNLRFFFKNITVKALYSRSEWILLARKITETERKGISSNLILDLIESISPNDKVTEKLPQYYKKLFSGRSSISEDFWIQRQKDEELFKTAINRVTSGYKGAILILGERNSGKSTFCRYTTSKLFRKEKVFHVSPVYSGSILVEDFTAELSKVTSTQGNIYEIMEAQTTNCVFVFHDIELWWERSTDGLKVINVILNLINEFSKRFIFVINMNPYAYDLINKLTNFQEIFISIIHLKPFDSKEIRELIIRRHRSSGLKFILKKTSEEELSEISIARLFNKYFSFSEGNPGTALKSWLANITKASENNISIRYPNLPEMKILESLDDSWKTVLIQLVLHKRLTYNKLNRIFSNDQTRIKDILNALLRTGLIEERNEDLFVVNTYIEPHLIRIFRKEELL
ncbi:MAG TPA: hypothetical protein VMV47_11965 [Bacteroidales bacterium]|nr:hypothetical protein [Bacteroidales bacterium]